MPTFAAHGLMMRDRASRRLAVVSFHSPRAQAARGDGLGHSLDPDPGGCCGGLSGALHWTETRGFHSGEPQQTDREGSGSVGRRPRAFDVNRRADPTVCLPTAHRCRASRISVDCECCDHVRRIENGALSTEESWRASATRADPGTHARCSCVCTDRGLDDGRLRHDGQRQRSRVIESAGRRHRELCVRLW